MKQFKKSHRAQKHVFINWHTQFGNPQCTLIADTNSTYNHAQIRLSTLGIQREFSAPNKLGSGQEGERTKDLECSCCEIICSYLLVRHTVYSADLTFNFFFFFLGGGGGFISIFT